MTDKSTGKPKNRADAGLAALAALYFAGVLLGALLYCRLDGESLDALNNIAGNIVNERLDRTFTEVVCGSFRSAFILLLACFWLGFGSASQPIELMVPVFRGLGAGVSVSGMYGSYGIDGIWMSAALIVPGAALSAFALIIASREALCLSGHIFGAAFGRNAENASQTDFRLYFTKFVILCIIITAAALADGAGALLYSELLKL